MVCGQGVYDRGCVWTRSVDRGGVDREGTDRVDRGGCGTERVWTRVQGVHSPTPQMAADAVGTHPPGMHSY